MWPVIRAALAAFIGYLAGGWLTVLVRGGSMTDEVALVFAFIGGLLGWLLGIGMWGNWVRPWLGLEPRPDEATGWRRYLTFNTDHKVIGVQYLATFIVVFLLGGVMALLMRWELALPGQTIMGPDTYNKIMSMHGILMVAVAVAGVLGSLGNFLVPLMIGANDMAFPKVNALSFWLVPPVAFGLLGAPLLQGSFDAGWTAYAPLSIVNGSGQVFFNLAVIVFGLSSILGGLNIVTTVATMRARGLKWGRLPIFVWAAFAASILSVLVTQFFAASLILILMDRVAGTVFFAPDGGSSLLYEHLFWFYSHPAVYIMVLPAFGVMLEIVTHLARKPLFAYKAVIGAFFGIVGLSVVVWAHHMFTSGMAGYLHLPFMVLTEAISIPTGLVFLSALGTLWEGKLKFQTPLVLVLGWLFNFTIGGLTGIFLADVATDIHLHDTYFVVAHFHYTIFGGSIFAFLAGSFFWFPKITGRMYNERWGRIFAVSLVVGFNVAYIPLFFAGVQGMNRRIADYPSVYAGSNLVGTIGAGILGISFLIYVWNILWSARRGPTAPANPWNATTLEWMVSSPPPHHNFDTPPVIVDHPYGYGRPGVVHATFAEAEGSTS